MDQEQSALSKYRADHRSRASRTGYPGQRMEHPAIIRPILERGRNGDGTVPASTKIVEVAAWNTAGKLSAFDLATGEPVRLTPGFFEEKFSDKNKASRSRLYAADRKTQDAIIKKLDRQDGNGSSHAKMLRAMTLLPFSSTFVNLAAALERRWWLPTEGDTASIGAWKSAFGITERGLEGFSEMLDYLTIEDGETIPQHIATLHKKMVDGERSLYDSARYSGTKSAMSRHAAAEHIEVVNQAILNMDPRSTNESMLSGETVRLEVTGDRRNGNVVGNLSTPCKLRQGKNVLLIEPASGKYLGSMRLHRMSLQDGDLTGEFATSKGSSDFGSNKNLDPLSHATNGSIYTVIPEPYLGGSRTPKRVTDRWVGRDELPKIGGRRVPIDVSIAGNMN